LTSPQKSKPLQETRAGLHPNSSPGSALPQQALNKQGAYRCRQAVNTRQTKPIAAPAAPTDGSTSLVDTTANMEVAYATAVTYAYSSG